MTEAKNKGLFKDLDFDTLLRIILSLGAVLCFSVFFISTLMGELSSQSMADAIVCLLVSAVLIAFTSVFFTNGIKIRSHIIFAAALCVSAAALALRLYLFNEVSNDYTSFLSAWLSRMRELSGVKPIVEPIGDYNMPYLYFLFGISRTQLFDLYQIKLLSVVFDFILAAGIAKLISLFTKSEYTSVFVFFFTLFVPTVFLNSAFWAQCDGIYAALCIWALYFGLKGSSKPSVIFFALAFSFKIQSIFILPIIIFLVIKKNIKLIDLLYFPLTFVLTLIPAILCGRNLYDTFSIYLNQTSSYPHLTLNCPTIWALFPEEGFEALLSAALYLAGAVAVVFCLYLYKSKEKLNTALIFDAAYLFTLLLPFFLPRMHERYFYLAEVLAVVYILLHRKRFWAPLILIFTSFSCYCAYLFGYRIFSLSQLTLANAIAILFLLKAFYEDISAQKAPTTTQQKGGDGI